MKKQSFLLSLLLLAFVSQLCAWNSAPRNIALGKTATQSSTGYTIGGAEKAIDGNTNGKWNPGNNSITHTNGQADPWWQLDLGSLNEIQRIKIWNRLDCCSNRLSGFYIMVSETPITANNTVAGTGQVVVGPFDFKDGSERSQSWSIDSKGRYIRIFIPGPSKILSLAEVEVFSNQDQFLDQEQIAGAVHFGQGTWWQSFTPGENGILTQFDALLVKNDNQSTYTMKIFEGEGAIPEKLIHEQSFPNGQQHPYEWMVFRFNQRIFVEKGKKYTVQLEKSIWLLEAGQYEKGKSSLWDASWDLAFKTYLAESVKDQAQENGGTAFAPCYGCWQSFTVGTSGTLAKIDGLISPIPNAADIILKVYQGEGVNEDKLLLNQSFPLPARSGYHWYSFSPNKAITLAKDQKYTIVIQKVGWHATGGDRYPKGRMYDNNLPHADFTFRSYVIPDASNYVVIDPNKVPTTINPMIDPKINVKDKRPVTVPVQTTEVTTLLNNNLASYFRQFNIQHVSSTVVDGKAAFSGTATIAGINAIEIEAILQDLGSSRIGLNTVTAKLPGSAQMAAQVLDEVLGTTLSKYIPVGLPAPTVRSFTIYFAENGTIPEAIEAVLGSNQPWSVLQSGPFSIKDISLSLGASGLNTSKKTIKMTLHGGAELSGIPMAIQGTLAGGQADGAEVVLEGTIKHISIGKLIRGIAGESPDIAQIINVIPPPFLNINIDHITAAISPTQKSFAGNMKASFGDFEVSMQPNIAGKMAFTIGIQPPNVSKIASLIGSSTLNSLQQLSDFNFALIVSSANGAIKSNLPALTGEEFAATKGLNVIGQYTLNQKHQQLLGVKSLNVTAQIPTNPINIRLAANVKADAKIGNAFTFKGITFELKPNPQDLYMGAGGDFMVHLKDVDLNFAGNMRLYPTEAKISPSLLLKAVGDKETNVWEKPFGIPGVAISQLGMAPIFTANFPWVGGSATGALEIGTTSKRLKGEVTFSVDMANPHKSLLDGKINNLSIMSLIDAFSTKEMPNTLRKGLSTGLNNVKTYIAPTPMNLFGKDYERGINISGQTNLFGLKSTLDLLVDPQSLTISCRGEIDKIRLESGGFTFFELSGHNQPNALVGFTVSPTQFPELEVNGAVTVMEIKGSTLIKINKDLLTFQVSGNLFKGAFKADVEVTAREYTDIKNADFYAKVKMKNEMQQLLSDEIVNFIRDRSADSRKALKDADLFVKKAQQSNSIPADLANEAKKGLDLLTHVERGLAVAGEYLTRGLLEETFNIKEIGFEGNLNILRGQVAANTKFTIFGQDVNSQTTINLNVADARDQIKKMAEDIGKKILAEMRRSAGSIGSEVDKLIMNATNEMGNFIQKGGEWVRDVAKEIGNWTKEWTEGKKMSRSLRSGEGYLSFFNNAAVVVRVNFSFTYRGQVISNNKDLTAGYTREFFIPPGASNIVLEVKGVATLDKEKFNKSFGSPSGLKKAYKVIGTSFNVGYREISPN
ncbi:MAG: discoidin domain-containing protein [Saprospiraceae bacterium]